MTVKRWLTLSLVFAGAGCSGANSGGWFAPRGERWTILALEIRGVGCQATAEEIAEGLRRTEGIKPKEVRVRSEGDLARIYYGTYYRRVDPDTRERSIPNKLREDLLLLKELGDPQGRHYFLQARKVPTPNRDVGKSEWDLRRADGVYTLQVAVYFNDEELHRRKLAAVAKVRQLRGRGFEAYYYHGESKSMVTVGTFGDEAVVDQHGQVRYIDTGGSKQQVVHRYSDEVSALQKRPEGMYNLTNDAVWYNRDDQGNRVPVRSLLVRMPIDDLQR